jgi:hypothetical protein
MSTALTHRYYDKLQIAGKKVTAIWDKYADDNPEIVKIAEPLLNRMEELMVKSWNSYGWPESLPGEIEQCLKEANEFIAMYEYPKTKKESTVRPRRAMARSVSKPSCTLL